MARIPRLYCDSPLGPGAEIDLPDLAAQHAVKVLRLRSGDSVVLFDGDGRDYAATLTQVSRGGARAQVQSVGEKEILPRLQLHLALGVSRGPRMDFALQKATELGVVMITPLFTERSLIKLDETRLDQRLAHWKQVTVAACEQSGRRRLPSLGNPQPFETWIAAWEGRGVLLEPRATHSLGDLDAPDEMLTLLVGPEGGLAARERAVAVNHGMTEVRLGPRILRTETAPLAAIAAMQMLWGDFR